MSHCVLREMCFATRHSYIRVVHYSDALSLRFYEMVDVAFKFILISCIPPLVDSLHTKCTLAAVVCAGHVVGVSWLRPYNLPSDNLVSMISSMQLLLSELFPHDSNRL